VPLPYLRRLPTGHKVMGGVLAFTWLLGVAPGAPEGQAFPTWAYGALALSTAFYGASLGRPEGDARDRAFYGAAAIWAGALLMGGWLPPGSPW
jgi:hypothetical protein